MRKRKISLMFLLPSLAFMSCSKDPVSEIEETEAQLPEEVNEDLTEVAFPEVAGNVSDIYFAGQKIPVEEHDGDFVYQGDIMIPADMASKEPVKLVYEKGKAPQQKSTGRTSDLWPNNTVYYAINGNLSNKSRVHEAINHWESKTDLDFVERSGQSNYIYFTSGSGCSSYIGMIGGKQELTLSSGCTTGNTIHEIGHAVGLWHEQSRADRDKYISIHLENVRSGMEHNFHTYEASGYDGDEYTTSLDFSSIMMYGATSFSKNGEPTITKVDGSYYQVQRSKLSSGDISGIKGMYPNGDTKPTYTNGEYYTIGGLTVLRTNDLWYYWTKYGFKRVRLQNDRWYWV